MVDEVRDIVGPRSGGRYCDCTVGTAGHGAVILSASSPRGLLLGLDRDPEALDVAARRLARFDEDRWTLRHAPFSQLGDVLAEEGFGPCDGVLADLGLSTMQLDDPERGFGFRTAGPLDMRMDTTAPRTVVDVIRGSSTTELARVLRDYGEERHAPRIARRLREEARRGRIEDTVELARIVRDTIGRTRSGGVDSATRTFQALRIAVNHELEELESLLSALTDVLAPGGVFACLSYHSLEDRRVKNALRKLARQGEGEVLTTKPLTPSREEVRRNRRARSAKLRGFRRAAVG